MSKDKKSSDFYEDCRKRVYLMGVLNVTPDSFSDGGRFSTTEAAMAHAIKLKEDGADILDIGGESSRPGADPISQQEELDRTIPLIEKISKTIDILISIDTYKSKVADEAMNAGAHIINDISGLTFDTEMTAMAAKHNAVLVIMHMKGTPKDMQANPYYDDPVTEILGFLSESSNKAKMHGITKIVVDPGLGFGKRFEDNFVILKNVGLLSSLGYPVLIGSSRKSYLGKPFGAPPLDRLEGTIASNIIAMAKGANILRVHDVKAVRRAVTIAEKILYA
jgi:dihydropteroate synthase